MLSSILCVLLSCSLEASSREAVTNNIDTTMSQKEKEKGWNFYQDPNVSENNNSSPQNGDNSNTSSSLPKASRTDIASLLRQILQENKEQTKLQKRMVELLEEAYDPKPEVITLENGEECIANSRAECYKMPITAEAKRIPALVAFMNNTGDIEAAANYIKWQSVHFKHAFNAGQSMHYANLQYADKINPFATYGTGFSTSLGGQNGLRDKADKDLLEKNKDKFKILIFIGLNADMDVVAFNNYMKFMRDMSTLSYELIFKDQDSKDLWLKLATQFKSYSELLEKKIMPKSRIDSKMFAKYSVYTSPTIIALYNRTENGKNITEARTVAIGSRTENGFNHSIVKLLQLQKVIPEDSESGYKKWANYSDYAYHEAQYRYGIDIDKDMIERLKRKQRLEAEAKKKYEMQLQAQEQ